MSAYWMERDKKVVKAIEEIITRDFSDDDGPVRGAVRDLVSTELATPGSAARSAVLDLFIEREVSPLDFGGVGDGTTDDYAALTSAIAAAQASRLPLDLGGRKWYSSQTLDIPAPIAIEGRFAGVGSGPFEPDAGAMLIFPEDDEIDGVILNDGGTSESSSIRNVAIVTDRSSLWSTQTAGDGNGLTVMTPRAHIENVWITGFHGHGLYVTSHPLVSGVNANHGIATGLRCHFNGRNGVDLEGSDTNVWTFISPDVIGNAGWGISNRALYNNIFINAHADANVTGDYHEAAWDSQWLGVYAENNGVFWIDNSDARGIYGRLLTGAMAKPTIKAGDRNDAYYAVHSWGWTIEYGGMHYGNLTINGPMSNRQFAHRVDAEGTNWYSLRDMTEPRVIYQYLPHLPRLEFMTATKFEGTAGLLAVATGSRPSASTAGEGAMIYDTTLDKPIWSDGTNWKDAGGTVV